MLLSLQLQSRIRSARGYTYDLLHTPINDTKGEQGVKIFLGIAVVLSVVAIALETVPSIASAYGAELRGFESIVVMVFSIEYLLRVWSAVEERKFKRPIWGRIKYMLTFFAVIDLIAILPYFIPSLLTFDFVFVRSIRLLMFIRLLKLGEYSTSLRSIIGVAASKKHEIGISLGVLLILVVIFSFMLYFFEHRAQPEVVTDIPMMLWWGIAKITSLSYVEIIPATVQGRICDVILSFLGLGFFALPSGILAAGFMEEIERRRKIEGCPQCNAMPESLSAD